MKVKRRSSFESEKNFKQELFYFLVQFSRRRRRERDEFQVPFILISLNFFRIKKMFNTGPTNGRFTRLRKEKDGREICREIFNLKEKQKGFFLHKVLKLSSISSWSMVEHFVSKFHCQFCYSLNSHYGSSSAYRDNSFSLWDNPVSQD